MPLQLRLPSLLIATPSLMDPSFQKSVLLMTQHNNDGAAGLILNRPVPANLRDGAFQKRYQIPSHVPVWLGGPVGTHQGLVLHNQGGDAKATVQHGDLRLSVSEEAIDGLIHQVEKEREEGRDRGDILYPFRFIIGSAGWGPKQLETELKAGAWIQKPFDEKLVFDTPWQEIWTKALEDFGIQPMDIAPTQQTYLN
jgi:putative transcriptional regulator